jgi:hypothetical protein
MTRRWKIIYAVIETAIVFAIFFAGTRLCRETTVLGIFTVALLVAALFAVAKLEAIHTRSTEIDDASGTS